MWKYTGKGAFILGIPARDLTDEEAQKIGISRLKKSGLYKKIAEPKAAKRSKEWQVSEHYEKSS